MRGLSLEQIWRDAPFTTIIMGINTVVFVLQFVFNLIHGYAYLETLGAINRILVIEGGEYWRLLTGAFLHSGLLHFIFNIVFGLGVLTALFERLFGSLKTAIFYFFTLLASSLLIVALSEPYVWTLGASGAIYGIMGALGYVAIFRKDLLNYGEMRFITSIIALNLFITLYSAIPGAGTNISVLGHLGGGVAGFLISFLFIPRDKSEHDIYYS